jgi:hypothetical protein
MASVRGLDPAPRTAWAVPSVSRVQFKHRRIDPSRCAEAPEFGFRAVFVFRHRRGGSKFGNRYVEDALE